MNTQFRHAKKSDWWFERHGVKVMAEDIEQELPGVCGRISYRNAQDFRNSVVFKNKIDLVTIAQALGVLIMPAEWEEKA